MRNCKPANVPLCASFMLSAALSPRSLEESRYMEEIPYSSAVGSVMYSIISTRPDLAQAISVLSRYMANPGKGHWNAMKWLLRYISSTTEVGLNYDCSNTVLDLIGYVDSDYAGTIEVEKVSTEENPADMGTKVVPYSKLKHCLNLLKIGEYG
ncbi:hypothetical protein LWI29_012337 [Acer saccharum]|uniref:Uncharacterized protein n=1 Tax=Acer saccharum TaxID=4024 RepID=A0AA39VFX4_ACESA|nr:hypothetical protein LWI29_012337 [Acer saccharum]